MMRFLQSYTLAKGSVYLCVIVGLAAAGCGKSTPTSPTPTGSVVARDFTDGAGTASFASVSTSARGVGVAIVDWDCFSGGLSRSCPAARVSAMGVATGEVVTTPPSNLT